MDMGSIITGVVIIAICIIPFVLLGGGGKKRKKQLLQALSNIAEKQNSKITQHDICGEFAIGLDETTNILFFYKKVKEKETAQYVLLSNIQSCKAVTTNRTSKDKGVSHSAVAKFELVLTPVDKNNTDIRLELYNAEDSMQLSGELKMMQKWEQTVNGRLKPQQKK
jgi:hypothetical protein